MVLTVALEPEQTAPEGDVFGRRMLDWPAGGGSLGAVAQTALRGRGPWHLDAERAFGENLAFVVERQTGLVGAVIMVTGIARYLNCRRLIEGPVIVDHPAIGQVLPAPREGRARVGYDEDPFSPPDLVQLFTNFWTLGAAVPTAPTLTLDDVARAVEDIQSELAAIATGQ